VENSPLIEELIENGLSLSTPEEVKELWKLKRRLIEEKIKAITKAVSKQLLKVEDAKKIKELLNELFLKIEEIEKRVEEEDTIKTSSILARELLLDLEERRERVESEFTTGFPSLDEKVILERSHYVVIGARPGVGKTTFMIQMALANLHRGKKVLFISLEMTSKELMRRIVAYETGISLTHIQRGNLTEEERERIVEFLERFKQNYEDLFFVVDKGGLTLGEILMLIKKVQPDVVFIDYLQLIKFPVGYGDKEAQMLGEVSKSLKAIAKNQNCLVVASTQINREVEKTASKRPTIAMVGGNEQIEQDADLILLLHSPEKVFKAQGKEVPWSLKGKLEVIIAKNRHGGVEEVITLKRDEKTGKFLDPIYAEAEKEKIEDLGDLEDLDDLGDLEL